MSTVFILNSALLGIGLAMDAFSVALANGLNEPQMTIKKMCGTAGIFAAFQGIMPLIGWICIHTVLQYFKFFGDLIPWIALILLGIIGGKMIYESILYKETMEEKPSIGLIGLIVQGIATSIDALSVGFTIAEYELLAAISCAAIITIVTFILCLIGILIGKRFGTAISGKAQLLGGLILIVIGLEIFISSFF